MYTGPHARYRGGAHHFQTASLLSHIGAVAQNKGAKAVVSSLWQVNDASTGELMANFYRRWAEGAGRVMKAEALRQAQLDLLRGAVTPPTGSSARGIKVDETEPGKNDGPAGYMHPYYYWAPFVLTGNWK
jgi:CHAT domain-containing protein